jgi:DNA mismatch repair protein MutL
MTIQKLPHEVIKLIAAGEVIDAPAAVVRELVENSLDADASRIAISVYPESWSIQVADNGRGINQDDLHLCVQPHTTSKIHSTQDLSKISTLGFRGEALHSIAQLADLSISSRTPASSGWEITYQQGKIVKENPVAIAPGTIAIVFNLFGNVPVRRQANLPFAQQLKQIQNLIGQLALCHPQVTWQLFIDDRLSLKISGGNTAQNILPQLLKRVKLHDLQLVQLELETPEENSKSSLELVLGLPDRLSRPRPDWVKIGVNGRVVKLPELEPTIFAALNRTLPRDRFPVLFLHLRISPRQIDWNRHPAKTEIYLHSLSFWQEQIKLSIDHALKITPAQLPTSWQNQRVERLLKTAENKSTYHLDNRRENLKSKDIGLVDLQVIAQVRNTYIIAEHQDGLWLIEQHIAHERVLYEQLQDRWKIVPIETPIILSRLNPKQLEQLKLLQLDIDSFGEDLWAVRSLPEMLRNRDDCPEALVELSWGGDLDSAQVAIACRSAIRNGTSLTLQQMQTLIDRWKISRNPYTCPHGRPIYLSLEESALYRFFRRHWVLGKSHGI